jgi:C1A family cysteine protease
MNKLALLAILAIFQIISCTALEHHAILAKFMDGPKKELFKVYHQIFNKEYDINTEEGLQKYKAFKDNVRYIKEQNSKGQSFELGINQFADMTNEEYKKTLNLNFEKLKSSFLKNESPKYIPDKTYGAGEVVVDYTSYFGDIKNQGGCGSCWAFATIGSIEGLYAKKFETKLRLSEQHLVDCDDNNYGCDGGNPAWAFDFVQSSGAFRESEYAYTSGSSTVAGQCKQTATSAVYKIVTGQNYCYSCTWSEWVGMLKEGPTEVVVDAGGRDWQLYKSGFFNPSYCNQANHAVIAVGVQNDAAGDYILVRNSWGTTWGDLGYIKVRVNASTYSCHVTENAWQPILSKGSDPAPNPQPQPPAPEPVGESPVLYKSCGYTGESLALTSSKNDLSGIGWGNQAKSFQIGSKARKVEFFRGKNCMGNYGTDLTLTANEKCFSQMNDYIRGYYLQTTASVAVSFEDPPAGCIWVYQDACYLGGKLEICNDVADLRSAQFNDSISSIRFGLGTSATLFIDLNFLGSGFGIGKDLAGFDSNLWMLNDSVTSIRIHRK